MLKFFTNGAWRPTAGAIAQIPIPVGEHCLACGTPIDADDCGVSMVHMGAGHDAYRPWHLACFRSALGIEGTKA
jgi:hypothetical protein